MQLRRLSVESDEMKGAISLFPKVEVEQDFDKSAQEFNIAADGSIRKLRASQLIKESQL
jgi:hypothetical protein